MYVVKEISSFNLLEWPDTQGVEDHGNRHAGKENLIAYPQLLCSQVNQGSRQHDAQTPHLGVVPNQTDHGD